MAYGFISFTSDFSYLCSKKQFQFGGNAPRGDGSVLNIPYAVIEKRIKCYNHRIK